MNNQNPKPDASPRSGRKPKLDKAQNCIMVRFTDEEYVRFLSMFEKSGVYAKAVFIKDKVFNKEFKVVTTNSSMLEVISILTNLHAQFRAVGVNINQITKVFQTRFSEKRAEWMLQDLLRHSMELIKIHSQVLYILHKIERENLSNYPNTTLK